jgi:hypothetical protein
MTLTIVKNGMKNLNAFQNKKGNSRCPFSGGRPSGSFSGTNLHAERDLT